MTQSFDEYVKANFKNLTGSTKVFMREAYEAGQASRQAEVDELQKKYDAAIKTNDMLVAYKNELLDEIENILKGQNND